MNQQQERSEPNDFRSGINLLYLLLIGHVTCITPFIRHTFGRNVPGGIGLFSVGIMFFSAAGLEDINILLMLLVWMATFVCHRLRMWWMVFHGWREHSMYSGWPWLAMVLFRVRDEMRAKQLEPLICLIAGLLIYPLSKGLGTFVMFGLISFSITRFMQYAARSREIVAIQDMEIEQRSLSERLRQIGNIE